jgi:hypothetical protein
LRLNLSVEGTWTFLDPTTGGRQVVPNGSLIRLAAHVLQVLAVEQNDARA